MRPLALLLLALACTDPAAPKDCDDHHVRYAVAPSDATASFMEQLPSGNIWLTGSVVVDSLELSDHATASNTIAIHCVGGWACQLTGTYTLRHTKDWVLLWHGVTLHNATLHAEYIQASRFTSLYVHGSDFIADHSTDISFRDSYIYDSGIVLNEAGQVLFDGGYVGSSRISYNGTQGVNGWAGPVTVMNAHVEHSVLRIENAQSANVLFNYFINVQAYVHARKAWVAYNDWIASIYNGKRAGCS